MPARNHKGERLLLFLGIIDILQNYRLFKKLEHTWKSILHDADSISVHNPSFYAERFQDYLRTKVFIKGRCGVRLAAGVYTRVGCWARAGWSVGVRGGPLRRGFRSVSWYGGECLGLSASSRARRCWWCFRRLRRSAAPRCVGVCPSFPWNFSRGAERASSEQVPFHSALLHG